MTKWLSTIPSSDSMWLLMRYLGIDYGEKRVGIALSDESGSIALPHAVLPNNKFLFGEVRDICNSKKVEAIVMGDSSDFRGKPNPIMKQANMFKAELERDLDLPVYLEPEFMTSLEAKHIQGENALHDASAAALILKSYLERTKNKK